MPRIKTEKTKKRITPQFVSPLAWTGVVPPVVRPERQSYIEIQEELYLDEYSLLTHIETHLLNLASAIHHYTFRSIPDTNDTLFHEDVRMNDVKRQRVLTILDNIGTFQDVLKFELDLEELRDEDEEISISTSETPDSSGSGYTTGESVNAECIVMSVINNVLDSMEEDEHLEVSIQHAREIPSSL